METLCERRDLRSREAVENEVSDDQIVVGALRPPRAQVGAMRLYAVPRGACIVQKLPEHGVA